MTDQAATGLIPLASYDAPPMPTQEVVKQYLGRLQALVGRNRSKPLIADDQLKKVTLKRLDDVVAPPACGPLLAGLGRGIEEWLADRGAPSHIQVVVLPPCDNNHVVETWARNAGHDILPAPSRETLAGASAPAVPDVAGRSVLVVPRLESWVLRHRDGLATVRRLLADLDRLQRPVVIGCNSWAWAFLSKATAADLLLPDPVTFTPFDGERLSQWFSQLAEAEDTKGVRFRLPGSGEDVLARDDAGALKNDYLQTLAGRSLGIPWVAWQLWRRSLRAGDPESDAHDETATSPGEQTLWIAALDEFVLPGADEQSALLVLHALLIHGPLTTEELRLVLPIVGESNIVPVLAKAGFVERQGAAYACRAAAYPTIRDGLAKAGLPMGII